VVAMKEIEAKIIDIEPRKIEETLFSLGAAKIFDGQIETTFFDFPNRAIINAKDVLRLRKEQDKIELTYKKVHFTEEAKIAEEHSVEVSSLEEMKKILGFLGLQTIESMRKHRISYLLNKARYDIDKYVGEYAYVPAFLEIEAENSNAIHKNAALLGFKPKDCLPWSTKELINHYSSKAKE
jgi:adenylate cyclase, class 2